MNAFSGTTRHSGGRLLSALVVVEVALALMLLVGAGLMTRSFAQLMRVSPGFEPGNLLAVQIYLPQSKYRTGIDRTRFYMDTIRRVGSLPGVDSAAGVSTLPMYPVGIDYALPFTIDGHAAPTNGEEPRADIRTATPGYFETMKIALLKGRFIDGRDRQGAPGHDRDQRDDGAALFRRRGSDRQGRPQPARQGRGRRRGRRREALRARQRAARRALHAGVAAAAERHGADRAHGVGSEGVRRQRSAARCWRSTPSSRSTTSARWSTSSSRSVFLPRVSMLLLVAFAISALLLAVVGIYGVVSYTVTQRTRELGVRMALGADAASTLRLVLGKSMLLVGGGTVCGLVASMAVTRAIAGLLYGVSPLDPIVFVGVSLTLAAAGFVASLIPARRATRRRSDRGAAACRRSHRQSGRRSRTCRTGAAVLCRTGQYSANASSGKQ